MGSYSDPLRVLELHEVEDGTGSQGPEVYQEYDFHVRVVFGSVHAPYAAAVVDQQAESEAVSEKVEPDPRLVVFVAAYVPPDIWRPCEPVAHVVCETDSEDA